ncbi:AAA family ATPase [Uliginosibacterium sp. H3]|uniref:AAA family ATPase n=1 Tax=Uliginosibacterium silvisoli TaxID=3114758 RepID=A0ABU6K2B5_9RHOO|nr:AAA family ATPase [Uliginosibacterium sp. H3]
MLIQRFFAPAKEVNDVGLREINMSRLGRFVALAGKNGAGKSRLLDKLEFYIHARRQLHPQVPRFREQLEALPRAMANNPGSPYFDNWKVQVAEHEKNLVLATQRIIPTDTETPFQAVRFVPKSLQMDSPHHQTKGSLLSSRANARNPGLGSSTHSLLYIQQLQDRWWNVTHPGYSGANEDRASAIEDYVSLNTTLEQLLGVSLNRDADASATMFGKAIGDVGFSDGQRVILQLCVALHAQRATLDNTIFLLDEPENHLHPSAAVDLLKSLYNATGSQIWIATHSVPLLAYVASIEPMSLWFVEDGEVTNAGRHPQTVLTSLLGSAEGIAQLNTFTGLPAQLAAINFATESLFAPKVVSDGVHDPQVEQIAKAIDSLRVGESLRLLDFGAGKGRLLQGIAAQFDDEGLAISDRLSYFAFDSYPHDQDVCKQVISTYFPDVEGRYSNTREDFFTHNEDQSVDVVVMCNVLHEIPPRNWVDLFSQQSLVKRALKEDGYILVVEDQRIPIGEKAHEQGFLVLDTSHLRTLFAVSSADVEAGLFVRTTRRDGRLTAHLIAKCLLSNLSAETRRTAVEQLKATAKQKIVELRARPANYSNGQEHGFWTQQFANASLFLDEVG